jgi:hypothetical protein
MPAASDCLRGKFMSRPNVSSWPGAAVPNVRPKQTWKYWVDRRSYFAVEKHRRRVTQAGSMAGHPLERSSRHTIVDAVRAPA